MAYYKTGTITLTNGSATVTGAQGANFNTAGIRGGDLLLDHENRVHEIAAVATPTQLTLARNYVGAGGAGLAYSILPTQSPARDLIPAVQTLVDEFGAVVDNAGAGMFGDGSAAAPGIRFTADQDTGLYRAAANVIGLATGGTLRVTVAASGNVGIGTDAPGVPLHLAAGEARLRLESTNPNGRAFEIVSGGNGILSPGFLAMYDVTNAANRLLIEHGTGEGIRINASNHLLPGADNSRNLGSGSMRFANIFLGTSPTVTSDARMKEWHGNESVRAEVFRRISRRILDELGWFQFHDSIARKGHDGARWHFGPRAQAIWTIVADEGLAAPLVEFEHGLMPNPFWQGPAAPAWITFDHWPDVFKDVVVEVDVPAEVDGDGKEIVPASTRLEPTGETALDQAAGYLFGIRLDQINAMLAWSLHERLSALEAK